MVTITRHEPFLRPRIFLPIIRQILCEALGTVTLVFEPLEINIFEDLTTLALLMDFLIPTVRAGDFCDWIGPIGVEGAGDSAGFSEVAIGPGTASASRTVIVTSALALL